MPPIVPFILNLLMNQPVILNKDDTQSYTVNTMVTGSSVRWLMLIAHFMEEIFIDISLAKMATGETTDISNTEVK